MCDAKKPQWENMAEISSQNFCGFFDGRYSSGLSSVKQWHNCQRFHKINWKVLRLLSLLYFVRYTFRTPQYNNSSFSNLNTSLTTEVHTRYAVPSPVWCSQFGWWQGPIVVWPFSRAGTFSCASVWSPTAVKMESKWKLIAAEACNIVPVGGKMTLQFYICTLFSNFSCQVLI